MEARIDRAFSENLKISPTQKFLKYGIPPIKLGIHVLIVLFTSFQVILVVSRNVSYSGEQTAMWNKLFLDNNANDAEIYNP